MIREMDSSGGGASAVEMFNKLTEVIRALNAMEEANTTTNTGSPKLSAPVCIECGLVVICNAVRGSGNCIAARSQLRASA